jgi:hypothetical protein
VDPTSQILKDPIFKSHTWTWNFEVAIDFNEFHHLVIWNDVQNYEKVDTSSIHLQETWPMQCWMNVIDIGWCFIKDEPSKFGIFNWILPRR